MRFNGLLATALLFAFFGSIGIAYLIRVALKGRARFERIEKQGGSILLAKPLMEMVYWVMQPVGRFIAFVGITATHITLVSLVFGLLAGWCLAVGHFGFGAIFATIAALMDALDGMVARHTGSVSEAGAVLDSCVDRYVEFFFIGGLVIYYSPVPVIQAIALLALMGSILISYTTAKSEALHAPVPRGSMRRPERAMYLIIGAALSPVTIPIFEEIRPYGIALGHPMVLALGLIAVMSNISAAERIMSLMDTVRKREQEQKDQATQPRLQSDPVMAQISASARDEDLAEEHRPLNAR